VVFLGELDSEATYDFLSRALALLFPICWREPFGMVLIETMACGTPVLATNRGAVGEIVVDGVTGFIRDTAAELGPLIDRIDEIDRTACRRHVAQHFSTDALVRGYTRMLPSRQQSQQSLGAASPMVFMAPAGPSTPRPEPHTPPFSQRRSPIGATRHRAAR
jgi:hypothetical protein